MTRHLVARVKTASALQRYMVCVASAVLPWVDSVHELSRRGSVIHRFLERVGQVGREEALAELEGEEYRAACTALDLDALPVRPGAWSQEVTFALDTSNGQAWVVGQGLSREQAYEAIGASVVAGTADVVGMATVDGRLTVYVLDFKTGKSELAKASRNWQLRFLATAAARAYGATAAVVALIHVDEDGEATYDTATFDAWDMDGFVYELARMVARIARALESDAPPPATTGDQCRWCPAITYCHAQTALIREVAGDPERVEGELVPVSPTAAALAWDRVRALEALVKRVKHSLATYATGHPFTLPNGLVVGAVTSGREAVDGATARAVLAALHGWEVADAACEFSSSKAAIKRALAPVAEVTGEKVTDLNKAAIAAIRAAGGITRNTYTTVKEHVPDTKADDQVAKEVAALTAELAA